MNKLEQSKKKLHLESVSVPLVYKIHIAIKFSCKNPLLDTAGEQRAVIERELLEFSILITLMLDLKTVRLFPKRMVPPICPGLCSGISITYKTKQPIQFIPVQLTLDKDGAERERNLTTGYLDSGLNSVELASKNNKRATDQHRGSPEDHPNLKSDRRIRFLSSCGHSPSHPRTLRANSHTASCIPKHTPAENSWTGFLNNELCSEDSKPQTGQHQPPSVTTHFCICTKLDRAFASRSFIMLHTFVHFYLLLKSLHVELNYRINLIKRAIRTNHTIHDLHGHSVKFTCQFQYTSNQ